MLPLSIASSQSTPSHRQVPEPPRRAAEHGLALASRSRLERRDHDIHHVAVVPATVHTGQSDPIISRSAPKHRTRRRCTGAVHRRPAAPVRLRHQPRQLGEHVRQRGEPIEIRRHSSNAAAAMSGFPR